MLERTNANSWYHSPDHGQFCEVIETQILWGDTTCRVWLPGSDSVVRIPAVLYKKAITRLGGKYDEWRTF